MLPQQKIRTEFVNCTDFLYFFKNLVIFEHLCYNYNAKQTKYTVNGGIFLLWDTYTLFWLYSSYLNLIKCKFRIDEYVIFPFCI